MLIFRDEILQRAKALVEDTKSLVSAAGGTQEQLARSAQSAGGTIQDLVDCVKLGAMSLGADDPDTQVINNRMIIV